MRWSWFPRWVGPLVLLFAIGTVSLRLAVVRTTYAIHQTEKKMQALRQDREKLNASLAQLRSPKRLEAIARTQLHWAAPSPNQVVYLK